MQTDQTLSQDPGMPLASIVPATVETRRTDISYEEIGLLADVDVIVVRINGGDCETGLAITRPPRRTDEFTVRGGSVGA